MLKVPAGTVVVSEKPSDSKGQTLENAEPGWFALRDRPALSGTDITNPKQEFGEFQEPNVTFEFTDKGREAFQEVTRQIAQRGAASAIGPSSAESAERPRVTSPSSSTTKSRPARSSTTPKTPTGSTAATARRSPAASTASPTPRT